MLFSPLSPVKEYYKKAGKLLKRNLSLCFQRNTVLTSKIVNWIDLKIKSTMNSTVFGFAVYHLLGQPQQKAVPELIARLTTCDF